MPGLVRRLLLALGFFACAFLIVGAWSYHEDRSVYILTLPLNLKGEQTVSRPFGTLLKDDYWVEFEIDRTFGFHETECLAGVHWSSTTFSPSPPTDCRPGFYAPDVTWTILADRHPMVCPSGFATGTGGFGATIERELCILPMRPGTSYVAQVSLHNVAPALSATHPRFRVSLNPGNAEARLVYLLMIYALAVALCGVGGALLVRAIWLAIKGTRRLQT
jgi:hypothetical protein